MYLSVIKKHLQHSAAVSVNDLVIVLKLEKTIVQYALNYWFAKGKIKKINMMCGVSCNRCGIKFIKYMWEEKLAND